MKCTLAIILMLIIYSQATAGELSLYNINSQNFPKITADIYALDDIGNKLMIPKNSVKVSENGIEQSYVVSSCVSIPNENILSALICVDISVSMSGKNIALAQYGINKWADMFPFNVSKSALTAFNESAYILSDFTNSKNIFKKAASSLQCFGATSLDTAFFQQTAGAVNLLKTRKNDKIIVLLSDGISSANDERIALEAATNGIKIYIVTLGYYTPKPLIKIAKSSGGMYFDMVNDENDVKNSFLAILKNAQGVPPCQISWISNSCSDSIGVHIEINKLSLETYSSYIPPKSNIPALSFDQGFYLKFGKVPPVLPISKQLPIRAENRDLIIQSINSNNPAFTISNYGGSAPPFILAKDSTRFLTVKFTPTDEKYIVSEFNIISNACGENKFYASGGITDSLSVSTKLKLDFPNGGEIFRAGADTIIKWSGIAPDDTVLVEYSVNPFKWDTIGKAFGNAYVVKMPANESSTYKMRLRQLSRQNDLSKIITWKESNSKTISLDYNPETTLLVTADKSGKVNIKDKTNGILQRNIDKNTTNLNLIRWSPNGKYIAHSGALDYILVWNKIDETDIFGLRLNGKKFVSFDWSPDSKRLCAGTQDGFICVWDLPNTTPAAAFQAHSGAVHDIRWAPDASKILTCSDDGKVNLWNGSNYGLISELFNYNKPLLSCAWDANSINLAVSDNQKNIYFWNTESNIAYLDIQSNTGAADLLAFNKDSRYFTYLSAGVLNFYSWSKSKIVYQHSPVSPISSYCWSKDGLETALGHEDGTIEILEIEDIPYSQKILSQDESDNFWSVASPHILVSDVIFNNNFVKIKKDSIVKAFVKNNGLVDLMIDSIYIQDSKFQLNKTYKNIYLKPNEVLNIDISALAYQSGNFEADIFIIYHGNKVKRKIAADFKDKNWALNTNGFDFGKINLGTENISLVDVIRNHSNKQISIDSIRFIFNQSFEFSSLTNFPNSISPNSDFSINLKYKPINKSKSSCGLAIYCDKNNIPEYISLYGEGIAPAIADIDTLKISGLACKDSSFKTLILTNTGNADLIIDSIYSEHHNESISFIYNKSAVIPGRRQLISIAFLPDNGSVTDNIIIKTNTLDDNSNQKLFVLTAVTDSFNIEISPKYINMIIEEKNVTKDTFLIVKNIGNTDLNIYTPLKYDNFTILEVTPVPIFPGDSGVMKVRFDGGSKDSIYIEDISFADSCGKKYNFILSASVGKLKPFLNAVDSISFAAQGCTHVEKDSVFYIKNSGSAPLLISSIFISDTSFYKIDEIIENTKLAIGDSIAVHLRFNANSIGSYLAELKIISNASNAVSGISTIYINSVFEGLRFDLSDNELNFGNIKKRQKQIKELIVFNSGTLPFTIDTTFEKSIFKIEYLTPDTIYPNMSGVLSISAYSSEMGQYDSFFELRDSCGKIDTIKLKADINALPDLTIQSDSVSLKYGSVSVFPVRLFLRNNINVSDIDRIRFNLVFNKSLLVPDNNRYTYSIADGKTQLKVDITPSDYPDLVINDIFLKALIGDTLYSNLNIDSVSIISNQEIIYESISGLFKLITDLPPLVQGDYSQIELIYPNPSSNTAAIQWTASETGLHKLILYDLSGKPVDTVFDNSVIPGTYLQDIKVIKYASGTYLLLLKTPTLSFLHKFVITK